MTSPKDGDEFTSRSMRFAQMLMEDLADLGGQVEHTVTDLAAAREFLDTIEELQADSLALTARDLGDPSGSGPPTG